MKIQMNKLFVQEAVYRLAHCRAIPEIKLDVIGAKNLRDFTWFCWALEIHSQFLSKGRNIIKIVFDFTICSITCVE